MKLKIVFKVLKFRWEDRRSGPNFLVGCRGEPPSYSEPSQRLRHLNYLTFGASFYSYHNSHLHKCSAVAEMGDRLATIDMDRKLGAVSLWTRGSWVPICNNVARAEAYLPTKWHLHPSSRLATTDTGRKLGAVSLWGG